MNFLSNYFHEICNVPEADEFFGIDEYSDLIVLTKPIVYMTIQEIGETHKILVENLDKIAPEADDQLRQIFGLLNHEPDLDSFTINLNTRQTAAMAKSDSNHNSFSKNTQLCLTLTNRFTENNDENADLNSLLIRFITYFIIKSKIFQYSSIQIMIRTKRLIIEIIYCQSGANLESILKTPATEEQVDIFFSKGKIYLNLYKILPFQGKISSIFA